MTETVWTDEEERHLWEVELPAQLAYDRRCAEEIWSKKKSVWAWVSDKDWGWGFIGWDFLKCPIRDCRRIVRLSLPEGGQLRVIEHFQLYHDISIHNEPCEGDTCSCRETPTQTVHTYTHYHQPRLAEPDPNYQYIKGDETFYLSTEAHLMVTTETDGKLHHFRGALLSTPHYEMNAEAVVFNPGTPQIVADRCAKIFECTMWPLDGENFYALLDGSTRCAICRHPLRDEVSKLVAVGPDCAKLYGIPHTLEAATKRLELRKKLLAEM
jgi:hypothetical protein